MEKATSTRVHTLDIVRGISMFFICGGELIALSLCACLPESAFFRELPAQFGHMVWEGFTFYDLIFPTFLLISGAAFTYSWQAQKKRDVPLVKRWQRLLFRTVCLCLLGFVYNGNLSHTTIDEMRFASVLARIGLCVFLAAIPYTMMPSKWRWLLFPIGVAGYIYLFAACGGETPYAQAGNWVAAVDGWLLPGVNDCGQPMGMIAHDFGGDAEGVISTFGAMWTAYLGMLLGDLLRSKIVFKPLWLYEIGVLLIVVAYGMEPWVPIVKKLWTASYLCLAGGWTFLLCGFVYLFADVLKWHKAFYPLSVLGVNALWFYFLAHFVDFNQLAWNIIGGATNRWVTLGEKYVVLIYYIAGFTLMWLMIWWVRRKMTVPTTKT